MPWLTINGISLAGIAALKDPPNGSRRDIGSMGEAADGSLVPTRITRKRDLKFTTKPLSRADAYAWECLLTGESSVWSFDSSFYSSKGEPGEGDIAPPDVQVQAGTKKYGAGALEVASGQSWATTTLGLVAPWNVAVWGKTAAGAWTHYVQRSDGAKWVDGVRNDAFDMSAFAEVAAGEVLLTCQSPDFVKYFDDLVVSPFLWPTSWPAQVFASGQPFGPAPFLTAAGDLVPEAATRRMVCKSMSEKFMVANLGSGLERDVRSLEFELAGA